MTSPKIFRARRLPLLAASGLLLGGLLGLSQPATAQSLEEALATAYQTNPTLRAARSELEATNEQVPQALSNWRPQVAVTGSAGRRYVDSDNGASAIPGLQTSGSSTSWPRQAALEAVQPLYRGGRTEADVSRAENEVLAQRSRLQGVEQEIFLRGVEAYMDVWRDEALVALNRNNEDVLRRQLRATLDRFEVGDTTRTDVAQAESRLAGAIAERINAEGQLSASRARYREVIGEPALDVEQPAPLTLVPENLDAAIALGQANNPAVTTAVFAERAALDQIDLSEGEFLPEINLVGRVATQRDAQGFGSGSAETAELLGELRIPLYQQGLASSRVRQAKQIASQRRRQIEEQRRFAEQQTVSAWESLESARAQIESLQEQVRAAEIALDGVVQEQEVGARTVLDVLDAQQELLNAQVSLASARRDETVASFQVLSAVGSLSAAALGLEVDIYDPQSSYDAVRHRWYGTSVPNEG